ncbi:hypothetical protein Dsin_009680 [Dipteronia sinensis]|uniref:RNase H type-1 domain-containing protein n=1 Tax=Dipteronia sinensis TaxID=43782 RepID=A0AAE0EDP8_9ROSI|nr:hypothetical protein Dsin_009680 [Dipteronia sinensis]
MGRRRSCFVFSFGRSVWESAYIGEKIGIGAVVRDSEGYVLACYCSQSFGANYYTRASNLVAIQKGLQFGIDCGLFPGVIELDNEEVIKWITNGLYKVTEFGTILMDIMKLSDCLERPVFHYVPKLANKAAQGLANYSLGIVSDASWLEEIPGCIDGHTETKRSG